MILRRVIAHFKKQEWTAIFLDFVIVALGVFLGLQVQEWNAARADRARESFYLAGLATDIRSDIAEIDEIIRVSTVRLSALDFLLSPGRAAPEGFQSARGLIAIEKAPPFSAAVAGSPGIALFILTTFDGKRLAYDTMINADGVGLIRDASLMREVQSYYAAAESLRDFEASLKDSRVKLVDAQQEAGISAVDETPAADLGAAFAADARLAATAKNYWLYTNRHVKLMRDLRVNAEALLARLESGSS